MLEAYGISAALTGLTAFLGSQYTQQSVQSPWYTCIRPWFAPPNWVFPVAWTTLYILLTIAFGLSILKDGPFLTVLHLINLILNVAWCGVFFGQRDPKTALTILLANLGVAVGILACTTVPTVKYLLMPYIAWLAFATAMNVATITKYKDCKGA